MKKTVSIKKHLESSDVSLQEYVSILEAEINQYKKNSKKMHEKFAKIEVGNLDLSNKVKALEKELKIMSKKKSVTFNLHIPSENKKNGR